MHESLTQLNVRPDAGWRLTLYPQAGEAGGSFVPAYRHHEVGMRGMAVHPERSRAEAARRARGKVRRYCAAHGLNRLGTLTYAPPFCTDPDQLRDDVGLFFRNLRTALGGKPLPYLWVAERHKDGQRFHVHFAVGQYVRRSLIDTAWGHGFVHIKLLGDLPVGSTSWDEARKVARYLSKYVAKTFEDQHDGRHRYEVAQGFTPQRIGFNGRTMNEVLDQAAAHIGRDPSIYWNSEDVEEWRGAPAVWVAWS